MMRSVQSTGRLVSVHPDGLAWAELTEPTSELLWAATEGVSAAASPAGAAAEVTPGESVVTSSAVADEPGHDLPAMADMLVQCLFTAGLAVQSAAALADGPVAAQLQQVTDRLDGIICDTRTAVFELQAAEHRYSPQAS